MSDQLQEQVIDEDEAIEEPQGEEEAIDWKSMARKHEREAKRNREAAAELERIKAERMTEAERLTARAEKAEAELAALEAERQRLSDAREVAKETDVPAELLSFCSDRERMEEFAALYASHVAHVPSAPRRQASRVVRDKEAPVENRDVFAEMMSNL